MKIKQLEWEQEEGIEFAYGFFGCFQVVKSERGEGFTASLNDRNDYDEYEEKDFDTIEEGKAYCQSLLEKQVNGALKFVEPEDNKSTWRRADNPPTEQDYYLTKVTTMNGGNLCSVNLYIPNYGWVVNHSFQTVVAWMPIPGTSWVTETQGDAIA